MNAFVVRLEGRGQVSTEYWMLDGDTAYAVGDSAGGPYSAASLMSGERLQDAVERTKAPMNAGWKVTAVDELSVLPGTCYPRIYRNAATMVGHGPLLGFENEIAVQVQQTTLLIRQLLAICRTVHPEGINLSAYGHETRNLIILACTEVEAMWKGVLRVNGVAKAQLTTNDYVQLMEAMGLGGYEVRWAMFPWLEPIRPFEGWTLVPSPTQTIGWYADYHAVKHDREKEFPKATLMRAFQAVAACSVMLRAQGSEDNLDGLVSVRSARGLKHTESYVSLDRDGSDLQQVNYPFK